MNPELSNFAARLRGQISSESREGREVGEVKPFPSQPSCSSRDIFEKEFPKLALELFALQFKHNAAYRKICAARKLTPETVAHWTQIPVVPTAAFKELELTSLAPVERTAVFHSSGTTEQKPSRHFHCPESLAVYEASLWEWFQANCDVALADCELICLTPSPSQVPQSSLVHMFDTVWQKISGGASVPASRSPFIGKLDKDGAWTLNFEAALSALSANAKLKTQNSIVILGTAFSFVHLLDVLVESNLRLELPAGSRVLETGGYKNRSRSLPKAELHTLITERLGVPRENILCEYGMSELSSQAYDFEVGSQKSEIRSFHFPPWARAQIISPETNIEVAEGETGLIRIFDLANVFSVAAIQTEDLGVKRGDGFELIGRAQLAEPRGCSLMTA